MRGRNRLYLQRLGVCFSSQLNHRGIHETAQFSEERCGIPGSNSRLKLTAFQVSKFFPCFGFSPSITKRESQKNAVTGLAVGPNRCCRLSDVGRSVSQKGSPRGALEHITPETGIGSEASLESRRKATKHGTSQIICDAPIKPACPLHALP